MGSGAPSQYHYNGVIMGAMASQITSLTIVYSTVYSRRRSKKTSKVRLTGLCAGNSPVTGEFPTQMASNAEKVSIWWRHDFRDETCNRHSCVAFLQIKRIPFRTNMHRHSVSIWYFAFYISGWLKACWARTVHSRYLRNILSKYHDRR